MLYMFMFIVTLQGLALYVKKQSKILRVCSVLLAECTTLNASAVLNVVSELDNSTMLYCFVLICSSVTMPLYYSIRLSIAW